MIKTISTMEVMEGTFPLELWRLFVVIDARVYGVVSRLSRRHYAALRPDLEHFKLAACTRVIDNDKHYWMLPNGQSHGIFTCYYSSGVKWYDADCVDGKLHGKCIEYYTSGNKRYDIDYVNGRRHGKWIIYGQSGDVMYVDTYINGIKVDKMLSS